MELVVCSGGQIGSDVAGLRAAKEVGFKTGGWLPKGCITLDGPRPDRIEEFGMQEHSESGYPPRTWRNVAETDATIRIATSFLTRGEICTKNAITHYNKPSLDIRLEDDEIDLVSLIIPTADWIISNEWQRLNIAGSALSRVELIVKEFLVEVFTEVKRYSCSSS